MSGLVPGYLGIGITPLPRSITFVGLEYSSCSSSDICGGELTRFCRFSCVMGAGVTAGEGRALLGKDTEHYILLRWRWMGWMPVCGSSSIAGAQDTMWSVIILVNIMAN